MKVKIIKLINVALLVCILFAAVSGSVYAWIMKGDTISRTKYSIIKLNSTVSMYKATDGNFNGVPDLKGEEGTYTQVDDTYYLEQYSFTQVGDVNAALSTEPIMEIDMRAEIQDAMPSQIYTFKYSLKNQGDSDNDLKVILEDPTAIEGDSNLWKTLSYRLVYIKGNGSSSETQFIAQKPVFEKQNKIYFCDYLSGGSEITLLEDEKIGNIYDSDFFGNYYDFWLQIEMEPYEVLKAHQSDFSLTQEEYNALSGKSTSLPKMRIYFELTDEQYS